MYLPNETQFIGVWNRNGGAVPREVAFHATREGARPAQRPTDVHISVTDVCNLSCVHCDIWRMNPRGVGENGLDAWKKVLDETVEWLGPTFMLRVSGGEPFVKKWLPELFEYAKGLGLKTAVVTNGKLVNERLAERMAASIDEIAVSIDAFREELHDTTRNRRGSHRAATEAVRMLVGLGHRQTSVSTILMKNNLDDVVDLVWWARETGAWFVYFHPLLQTFSEPFDPHWYRRSELWPDDYEKVCAVIDELRRLRATVGGIVGNEDRHLRAMKFFFRDPTYRPEEPCTAGRSDIFINPRGHMLLCPNLDAVGNVNEGRAGDFFEGEVAWSRREEVYHCSRNCHLLGCVQSE